MLAAGHECATHAMSKWSLIASSLGPLGYISRGSDKARRDEPVFAGAKGIVATAILVAMGPDLGANAHRVGKDAVVVVGHIGRLVVLRGVRMAWHGRAGAKDHSQWG